MHPEHVGRGLRALNLNRPGWQRRGNQSWKKCVMALQVLPRGGGRGAAGVLRILRAVYQKILDAIFPQVIINV